MVLLVTIGLVIVSALTLALGFIQDNVGLIYASIACSVAAAVILIIAGRNSGGVKVTTASGPAPLDLAPAASDGFPIADYDELLVTEVVPLLASLSASELQTVRSREEGGKARASVLRRIDSELEGRSTLAIEDELEDDFDEATAAIPAVAVSGADDDEPFPIEDYDDLRASEIMPLLPQLYADELELVAERERSGADRAAILDKIDDLLNAPLPGGETTVKKAAAKKAAAKKAAPAKKAAVAAKKAAPAKKAAVPAKKAAPVKQAAAPAKKAAAPAKKAAPTKKAAAPIKKAAATKAPAKKAAATKKAR